MRLHSTHGKLTWAKVRELRRRYARGIKSGKRVNLHRLAKEFGIAHPTVYGILAGTYWREKGMVRP